MLGVNVPVLALSYPTLHELLPNQKFGMHFETENELASQMADLLKPQLSDSTSSRFRAIGSQRLLGFRQSIQERNQKLSRGFEYWKSVALPVYESVLENDQTIKFD